MALEGGREGLDPAVLQGEEDHAPGRAQNACEVQHDGDQVGDDFGFDDDGAGAFWGEGGFCCGEGCAWPGGDAAGGVVGGAIGR